MLSDCVSPDKSKAEIYIVRQSSAGEKIARRRDRFTQAVLPLDPEMVEIQGARLDAVLDDENVKWIIAALGAGVDLCEGEWERPMIDLNYLR